MSALSLRIFRPALPLPAGKSADLCLCIFFYFNGMCAQEIERFVLMETDTFIACSRFRTFLYTKIYMWLYHNDFMAHVTQTEDLQYVSFSRNYFI